MIKYPVFIWYGCNNQIFCAIDVAVGEWFPICVGVCVCVFSDVLNFLLHAYHILQFKSVRMTLAGGKTFRWYVDCNETIFICTCQSVWN